MGSLYSSSLSSEELQSPGGAELHLSMEGAPEVAKSPLSPDGPCVQVPRTHISGPHWC